jgi:hypothetical protein
MDGFMEYVSSDTWARIGRRIEKEAEAAVDAASDNSPLWTMFNEEPSA